MGWARIPRFYKGFYVYKYAAAVSADATGGDFIQALITRFDNLMTAYGGEG